mmetsp:Transcript_32697/g.78631  ORF Transcript_32697/g.78631 Transcript_32697/m.78631 type:complete len:363 (-) Transcript_32697:399-1487(-)
MLHVVVVLPPLQQLHQGHLPLARGVQPGAEAALPFRDLTQVLHIVNSVAIRPQDRLGSQDPVEIQILPGERVGQLVQPGGHGAEHSRVHLGEEDLWVVIAVFGCDQCVLLRNPLRNPRQRLPVLYDGAQQLVPRARPERLRAGVVAEQPQGQGMEGLQAVLRSHVHQQGVPQLHSALGVEKPVQHLHKIQLPTVVPVRLPKIGLQRILVRLRVQLLEEALHLLRVDGPVHVLVVAEKKTPEQALVRPEQRPHCLHHRGDALAQAGVTGLEQVVYRQISAQRLFGILPPFLVLLDRFVGHDVRGELRGRGCQRAVPGLAHLQISRDRGRNPGGRHAVPRLALAGLLGLLAHVPHLLQQEALPH